MLAEFTRQLGDGASLSPEQVTVAAGCLVDEGIGAADKADFLIALAQKGETVEEISGFARELRSRSVAPVIDSVTRAGDIMDVCGTGGDHLNTFNISTTVALVLAAAGVTVAKHGNRAVTSQSGSADVLEALGIAIDLTPEAAGRWLRDHHFAFFFAPRYHPAFKAIGPARKLCAERKQRTIFNFLGPLLNPARPTAQLIGVPNPRLCEPVAKVLQSLGIRRGMVVSGQVDGVPNASLDEISTLGETTMAEFYQDRGFLVSALSWRDFPIRQATLADLAGGDREVNARIIRELLGGADTGPKREAVLLNCAAAFFVAGKTASMQEGWALAGETIDSGRAQAKLAELIAASREVVG